MSSSHPRSRFPLATLLATALACVSVIGCGDDSPTGPPTGGGSTTYEGTIVGPTSSGGLTLVIATSTPAPQPGAMRAQGTVNATGTLWLPGAGNFALTGTYDDAADSITVAGSGWTFDGGLRPFGMGGTYTGPNGTGVFSVQPVGTGSDTVIVVVGTYTATVGTGSGNFNFSIRGTLVRGHAYDATGGDPIPLYGTYAPGTGDLSVDNPAGGGPLATGTLQGNGVASGVWNNGQGDSGTWTGARQ